MKKILFSLFSLCVALLFSVSTNAQDCATTSGTTVPDICGSFTLTIDAGTCTATADEGFLLIYDFDPSTVPTQEDIYNDLVGDADITDLEYFGETFYHLQQDVR